MKRLTVACGTMVSIFGMVNFSHAIPSGLTNLLQNSSFESSTGGGGSVDFAYWNESGEWYKDGRAYDGLNSARLGVQTGSLYQPFAIIAGDALHFGAYFSIITNDIDGGNWDQTQINMQIAGLPDTTIGGSVSNFSGLSWSPVVAGSDTYISNWFLVATMVDISGIALPANSAMNISMQNYNPANTRLLVDGAYAGVTNAIPEPATLFLFGTGMAGLAAIGRRKKS